MELIKELKIQIPLAFRPAINICDFNEGDVIHDNEAAYLQSDWFLAKKHLRHTITVTSSLKLFLNKNTSNAFNANWHKQIVVEIHNHCTNQSSHHHTTNGSLFRYLETKNIQYLISTKADLPPLTLKDIKKILRKVDKKILFKTLLGKISEKKQQQTTYIIPHCTASEISIKKLKDIRKSLSLFCPQELEINTTEIEQIFKEDIANFLLKKEYLTNNSTRIKPTIKLILITVNSTITTIPQKPHLLIFADEKLRFCLNTTNLIKHYNCINYKDRRLQIFKKFNLSNHLIKVNHNEQL